MNNNKKTITRKRINTSEPTQGQKERIDQKLANSYKEIQNEDVPYFGNDAQDFEFISENEIKLEQQMGGSVVSEYVQIGEQMLSPENPDASDLLDEITEEAQINQMLKRKLQRQQNQNNISLEESDYIKLVNTKAGQQSLLKKQKSDDEISHNTTSEMNALTNIREQQMRKPIYLNVMVCGEQGLGKSTFIDLFLTKRFKIQQVIRPQTKTITLSKGQRIEGKITFNINMIDTPGYTQGTEMKRWYQEIRGFIVDQFEKFNQQEEKIFQSKMEDREEIQQEDSRVHCIIYFISGPRIKKIDLQIIKKLQKYANIIPVLAKGDCYTQDEIIQIKKNLEMEVQKQGIKWFNVFNTLKYNKQEYLTKLRDGPMGQSPPFVMVASVKKIELKPNVWVFGRKYKWGGCNVEDPEFSDFNLLYSLIIGHISLDLIEQTKYFCNNYFKQKKVEMAVIAKKEQRWSQFMKWTVVTIIIALGGSVAMGKADVFSNGSK